MRFNHPAAAAAFRAVAGTFGETVRIVPMLPPSDYAETLPDDTRPPVDVRAVVALSPGTENFDGARTGPGKVKTLTRIATRKATIWLTAATFAGISYPIRAGDRVVLVSRAGSPTFTVSREPATSDRGDVALNLVHEGYDE